MKQQYVVNKQVVDGEYVNLNQNNRMHIEIMIHGQHPYV